MKKAVVLVNLGTPDDLTRSSVKRYLKEFLLDPYVIDIPALARQFLVRGLIVPFRAKNSLEAYRQIWTKQGSPLLVNSVALHNKISEKLKDDVYLCMRYGNPSIESVFKKLTNYDDITVVPLYPQYALSATETVIQKCHSVAKKLKLKGRLSFVPPFFAEEGFVQPLANKVRPFVESCDHILFSFHGLPARHITKLDPSKTCLTENCCDQPGERLKKCYKAQCTQTMNKVAQALSLKPDHYSMAFQSRLGKGWLEPFTDVVVNDFAKKGVKKLAVVCPAFVSDCLETLEEIQIRAKEEFIEHGGEDLFLVPCVNASEDWCEGLAQIIKKHQGPM